MGLRFRRSISLCKGVKLNFGLKGVSLSTGIPGFRRTVHSSGRVTTSFGIPSTGLYYTTTENKMKNPGSSKSIFSDLLDGVKESFEAPPAKEVAECPVRHSPHTAVADEKLPDDILKTSSDSSTDNAPKIEPITDNAANDKLSYSVINSIFEQCDKPVNWIDVISNLQPTDADINPEAWLYLHKNAVKVFDGDVDTYLEIIQKINPYDDLLEYAENIEFGADSSDAIEVEFSILDDKIPACSSASERNLILQDYVCAIAIRIARDTFALLPTENVVVHATSESKEILSVSFTRVQFADLQFAGSDASNLIEHFEHKMNF